MTESTSNLTMQDFIFGGIEADPSLLLDTEQDRRRGIRHHQQIAPLDPLPDEPVTLTVTVGQDAPVDRVTAYVSVDGRDPVGPAGNQHGFAVEFHRVDVQWQPLIWDYVEIWQGEIPGQPEGTMVHYRIEGRQTYTGAAISGTSHWSREQNLDCTQEVSTLYGYHVDRFVTPTWAKSAVIYQILVDRFARGSSGVPVKEEWLSAAELDSFMGGNLPGIAARLDYIADLGATAIWLTPIFTADAYHAYDTVDYYQIDPRFGTKDDLRTLVSEAHRRGIRVILDFVANHTSSQAPIFQQAQNDANSVYRDWFSFAETYTHGYRCFFDVAEMPQFNTDSRAARQFLCEAAQYWLREFDIDGYRLDYAAGPGHSFWSEFGAACKRVKPDCWLFGEVTRMGDLLRSYSGRLDGCLDFGFTRAVRQLCAGEQPTIPLGRFAAYMERSRRFFPDNFVLPAFLDNHDMNRFLWVAGNRIERLKLGLGLLMALGGSPILYYGTEVGLSQPRSKAPFREEARHAMRWGSDQNTGLYAYTRALINLRKTHPALIRGEIRTHLLDEARSVWLLSRNCEMDEVWIAINLGTQAATVTIGAGSFVDLESGAPIQNETSIPAREIRLFVPNT